MTVQPVHSVDSLTLPPQSVEAEQSVLGGLMLNNSLIDDVSSLLSSEDFYRSDHRSIYHAIVNLCEENDPADVVTVSERLANVGDLEKIGGLAYLGTLAKNTPNTANVIAYAKIVQERAILRKLIDTGNNIIDHSYHPEGRTPAEILDQAEQSIFDIAGKTARRGGGFMPIKALLTQTVERINELFKSKESVTGVPTGFNDLDNMTSGLQPGDLVIVAGRPSMGKTALAMNLAEHAAIEKNLPVAIFSMEMPGQQLSMRLLASLSRVNAQRLRTGQLHDEDWPRISGTMGLLSDRPIYIDDTPGLNPLEIRTRARRLAREHEHGLGMIVIDYIQLMASTDNNENRATEISGITRSLKTLAKELNVPVVALSQLNRSLENRPNKRPVMSDLRESGAIEQDADVIFFIYRDEVYNEDSKDKGVAEIIIGKQRNGPIGTVRLTFFGEYTRFENFTTQEYHGIVS